MDSVLSGSSFRCSDNTRAPVLLDILVWERQICLILFDYFLAKHLGVWMGGSYDNDLVCG